MADTTIKLIVLNGSTATGKSTIHQNTCRKEAFLTPMPMYLMDSNDTDVFDFGGVTKTVNLQGSHTDNSVANLKSWVDSLEALVQGHQDVDAAYPLTFTDDLRGTLLVKVMDFESEWVEGAPLIVKWTLKIIQSSTTS